MLAPLSNGMNSNDLCSFTTTHAGRWHSETHSARARGSRLVVSAFSLPSYSYAAYSIYGGRGQFPPPKKIGKKYFWGKNHAKFGHFVNFHAYIFGQKCLALPKLTQLLSLRRQAWCYRREEPNKPVLSPS